MSELTKEQKYRIFVNTCLSYQGAPYIWGGKGLFVFDPIKLKLQMHKFVTDQNVPISVFDCSGLVTLPLYNLFGIDLRATHSAAEILRTFPECNKDFGDGCLILYHGHVAVDLGRDLVVDANRGDHTCLSVLDAKQRGAQVEVHRTIRPANAILGYRRIPLDKSELRE